MNKKYAFVCVVAISSMIVSCKKEEKPVLLYDYGQKIETVDSRNLKSPLRQQFIDQAKVIRTKFEPWAKEHQALLQPVKSEEDKRAQFKKLYEALPGRYIKAGITALDMNPRKSRPLQDENSVVFTWNAFKTNDDSSIASGILNTYLVNGDFPLCESINIGSFHIVFWSSGRITENCPEGHPCKKSEITPAYDFLVKS